MNSPNKTDRILVKHSLSELDTNTTNLQMPENVSDANFSDEKISTSCKSVRFSNRLDDNKTISSRRDEARTPSILKNKNRKYGTNAGLTNLPS